MRMKKIHPSNTNPQSNISSINKLTSMEKSCSGETCGNRRRPRNKTNSIAIASFNVDCPPSPSTLRSRRISDSILHNSLTANRLRERLEARRLHIAKKSLIVNNQLSTFILQELKQPLNVESAVYPTSTTLERIASKFVDIAMHGYFNGITDAVCKQVKDIVKHTARRHEYESNVTICSQHDPGDYMYIIEEGYVQFTINNELAGSSGTGTVFGELDLIYGISRQCDVTTSTKVILWTIDSFNYRRIQAILAKNALLTTKSNIIEQVGKTASLLGENYQNEKKTPFVMDNLTDITLIGEGSFGCVYSAWRKGEQYAIKRLNKNKVLRGGNEQRVNIERNALQAVHGSSFVVTFHGTWQDNNNLYIVTDCAQGGHLLNYMIEKDTLDHEESCFFTYNIVKALSHCYGCGYIHRDLKPENCLIDDKGYVKLCDFGLAKRMPCVIVMPSGATQVMSLAFTMCGTPEFMAPEFVLSIGYDKRVDIWALGCCVYEMYVGNQPFDFGNDLKKMFKRICIIGMGKGKVNIHKTINDVGGKDTVDFLSKIFTPMSERIGKSSYDELLYHPYFKSIDKKQIEQKKYKPKYIPPLMNLDDVNNSKKCNDEINKQLTIQDIYNPSDKCTGSCLFEYF